MERALRCNEARTEYSGDGNAKILHRGIVVKIFKFLLLVPSPFLHSEQPPSLCPPLSHPADHNPLLFALSVRIRTRTRTRIPNFIDVARFKLPCAL